MSNHWYDHSGNPVYQVQKSKGDGYRDTTMRDARKMHLYPSVTTIIRTSNKPSLNTWLNNQIIDACAEWPFNPATMDREEWEKKIRIIYSAYASKAAEKGAYYHDLLEKYFKEDTLELSSEDENIIMPVIEEVKKISNKKWIAERAFTETKLGYGGKIDMFCPEDRIILDFKSKATSDLNKMDVYEEHGMQLAAYSYAMHGESFNNCLHVNILFSTETPKALKVFVWERSDIEKSFTMYKHLFNYWKLLNKWEW